MILKYLQWRIQDFPKVGAPTYDFAKISQKIHEIEIIWTPREGATSKILLCRSDTDLSQKYMRELCGASSYRFPTRANKLEHQRTLSNVTLSKVSHLVFIMDAKRIFFKKKLKYMREIGIKKNIAENLFIIWSSKLRWSISTLNKDRPQ